MAFPLELQTFFSLPQLVNKDIRYYADADNSRFSNDPSTYDVTVRLPTERRSRPRTVMLFETAEEAESYQRLLNHTSHPSILRPVYYDCRATRYPGVTAVALIFDRYPDTVEAWAEKHENGVGVLDGMWLVEGVEAVCTTEKFKRFYGNLVEPLMALHDDNFYHGKLGKGLRITEDLQVKLAFFKRVRVDDEDDMHKGQREDLRAFGRMISKVIAKTVPTGVHLPASITLYFHPFVYLSDSHELTVRDLRLLAEYIYMPPFVYDWMQRYQATLMTWDFKKDVSEAKWPQIFPYLSYPGTQFPLFSSEWRSAISTLGSIDLRNKLVNKILCYPKGEYVRAEYEEGYGMLDFHRSLLSHFPTVFEGCSLYEAEDLLFGLWPNAVSMFLYALVYLTIDKTWLTDFKKPIELPNLLDLMKKHSLLRNRSQN